MSKEHSQEDLNNHTRQTASEQYMNGEITRQELEKREQIYAQEFKQTILALARKTDLHNFHQYYLPILCIVLCILGFVTFLITQNRWALVLLSAAMIPLLRLILDCYLPGNERSNRNHQKRHIIDI